MRTPKDFFVRPVDEQRWLLQNTWCHACAKADLGMTDPAEYEEGGVRCVAGKCRKCGATVLSALSEAGGPLAELKQYSVVRVCRLLQSPDQYNGWNLNQRSPTIGDVGVIVDVLQSDGLPNMYVVEMCAQDGSTVWLGNFCSEELEAVNGAA